MQVSGTKIKTDWEKLQNEKISESIQIKNKPSESPSFSKTTFKNKKNLNHPFTNQNFFGIYESHILSFDTIFREPSQFKKLFFDNLGVDQNVISEYGKLCDTIMKETSITLDAYGKFVQIQSDMFSNSMEMYLGFLEQGLDWYSKIMSSFITKK